MKANEWTRDTLTKIGLENAHLEDWGEFGLGWQQLNTWARHGYAGYGGADGAGHAVVALDHRAGDRRRGLRRAFKTRRTSISIKGKLAGKIVLFGAMREVPPVDKPLFERYTDAQLGGDCRVPGERERGRAAAGDDGAHARADAAHADDRQDCAVFCRRKSGRGD